MQVQHIMRTNVQFIHAGDTLDDVLHFIERSTYSHFTVVDDDSIFVGVIHFSDVREVMYDPAARGLVTAVDLVGSGSVVVPMEMPLDELLKVFTERNVGVLPVVESAKDRQIVGVVEQRDLLRALHLSQLSQ
ncbi:MAG: CBS domain-containing protein [Acidobacteria bacterium]|nr:CBS domain-containing protein [Acidobacteriota bacterium]